MSTKIALLSDIHGNSPALQAVLNDIEQQGCTELFMLGDIINGVDPHGCIQLLRAWCDAHQVKLTCLRGNGEAYLLTPDRDALPHQDKPWVVEMLNLVQWWQDHLTEEDLAWIRSFQDHVMWDNTCLVHDRPWDRLSPTNWHKPELAPKYQEWFFHSPGIYPTMPEDEWQKLWAWMDQENFSVVFCGHTHIPFQREFEGKQLYNLGSVGAPLDGDPRPSWALATKSLTTPIEVSLRRVEYDIALIHNLIEQTPDYYDFKDLDFKEAYKQWLATGLHWKVHLHGK